MGESPLGATPSGPTKGQEGRGRLPGTNFGGFRGCVLNDFADFQFGFLPSRFRQNETLANAFRTI